MMLSVWVSSFSPAMAQEDVKQFWWFSEDASGPIVLLDPVELDSLAVGDQFQLRLDGSLNEGYFTGFISDAYFHANGDVSWSGNIENTQHKHSLVITRGRESAYASISSPIGVYQLAANFSSDNLYRGKLERYSPVKAELPERDFISLDTATGMTGMDNNLRVTQEVPSEQVAIGESTEISLTVTNEGSQRTVNLYADIFFLLETTDLLSASESCQASTSMEGTPVLSCFLGDIDPGQTKTLSYSIQLDEESFPLVESTVLVNDARSDLILEVYRDVLFDGDNDGFSDFDETLLGSDPGNSFSTPEVVDTVIDVLAVYANDVHDFYDGYAETRLNQLIAVANKIYRDSLIDIRLRLVDIYTTEYQPEETLLDDLKNLNFQTDAELAQVQQRRDASGADLTVLFRTSSQQNALCGLANLIGKGTQGDLSAPYQRELAYSVININCLDDSVLAHELGHNMGLVHSRLEDPDGGTFSYSAGYGLDSEFVTIMAYSGDYNTDNKVFHFSAPDSLCGNFSCGIDEIDFFNAADAAKSLNLVRHQVAAFNPSWEQRLDELEVVTSTGALTVAQIWAGIRESGNIFFDTQFKADEVLELIANFKSDPNHVGLESERYMVLVLGDKGHHQFDRSGKLVPWDGKLSTLIPLGVTGHLPNNFVLNNLNAFRPAAHGFQSGFLSVFFGYRLMESGTLVFSRIPLSVQIMPVEENVETQ